MATKKDAIETPVTPAPEDATLASLEAQFGVGKAFRITGKSAAGKDLVGYYRYPDYETKKAIATKLFFEADQLGAGETILARCHVLGDHLYTFEEVRLEAALHCLQNLPDVFQTLDFKKN